ncbi:MAG TPA: hypothetical protein VK753_05275 [Xanthomonadaceae bacterium]|jgi:hypothetical protein|nr:hypothetical protein [Xanthomonadaceae bacterium]
MIASPDLREGIPIPAFGITIPWLISQGDLFRLIPEDKFQIALCGGPSMLRFELLGFKALFWFNFVTHPDGQLIEVQFRNDKPRARNRTYRKAAVALVKSLGKPNMVDQMRLGQQTWLIDDVRVTNSMTESHPIPGSPRKKRSHHFSVWFCRDAWRYG